MAPAPPSGAAPHGIAAAPRPVHPRLRRGLPAAGLNALLPEHGDWRFWRGVEYDLGFVAFCAYVVSIITYILPIGDYAIAAAMLGVLIKGEFRFPLPLALFALFLLWCLLGYASSPYPAESWIQLENDFKVFVIAVVGVNVLTTTRRVRFFSLLVLTAFASYPVRGAIFNYFIYGAAEDGRIAWNFAFENPNDLAAYCLIPFALCAGMLRVERDRWIRYACVGGLALIPLVIFLTGSRGAMLGLLTFGVAAFLGEHKYRGKMIAASVAALIIVAAFAPKSSFERLFSLASASSSNLKELNDAGSAEQRYQIWRVARAMAVDNPIVGVGTGAYKYVHNLYVARRPGFDPFAGGQRDTHSTYLNVAAETGFPGAIIFSLIFLTAAAAVGRARRRLKDVSPERSSYLRYLRVGLLAFLTAGIFGTYVHIAFTYLLVVILVSSAKVFEDDVTSGRLRRAVT